MMELDALYREVVLDHHRDPRGNHPVARVDAQAEGLNPACGDEVTVQLELAADRIADVGVCSRGCAISVASGSMLAELLEGASVKDAERLAHALQRMLRGETEGLELDTADDLGDLEALGGVRQFPARIKCAALPWMALLEALRQPVGREGAPAQKTTVTTESDAWQHPPDRTVGATARRRDDHHEPNA